MKQLDELNKNIMDRQPVTPERLDHEKNLRDLENDYDIWRRKVEAWKSKQNENK